MYSNQQARVVLTMAFNKHIKNESHVAENEHSLPNYSRSCSVLFQKINGMRHYLSQITALNFLKRLFGSSGTECRISEPRFGPLSEKSRHCFRRKATEIKAPPENETGIVLVLVLKEPS